MVDVSADVVVAIFQVLAAVATFLAAGAAWLAVRHARDSARAAREGVLLPLKQKHTEDVKALLGLLEGLAPVVISRDQPEQVRGWREAPVESSLSPALDSFVLFDNLPQYLPMFRQRWDAMKDAAKTYLEIGNTDSVEFMVALKKEIVTRASVPIVIPADFVPIRWWRAAWWLVHGNRTVLADFESEAQEFEVRRVGDTFRVVRPIGGSGTTIWGTLGAEDQAQAFVESIRTLLMDETWFESFGDRIRLLDDLYEKLSAARNDFRQLRVDIVPTVLFPEECSLLGLSHV